MKRSSCLLYFILLILVLGALIFRVNPDGVYASLGNYYFKHNNISKAQYFYEKAFANGYEDIGTKDLYVNSILNSPLDTDAQEKLVNFVENGVEDEPTLRAKKFLKNLRNKINYNYPNNYIRQATLSQQIVRWNKFPITYGFINTENADSEYIEEIRRAFNVWENVGNFIFAEVKDKPNIIIKFINNDDSKDLEDGKKYVIAYTVPHITSKKLLDMNINFYIYSPEGNKFTRNQIYSTALHEICHALGFMGHSLNSKDVMYMSRESSVMYNDTRASLTEADVATINLLYKIKPDITNSSILKSEYVPYLVLGDDDELNASKTKEAKNYIRNAPGLPSGYLDLAESLVAQKRYADAIRSLEKALYLSDNDDIKYIIYYNLAVSYFYIAHADMALEYIDKAMLIDNTEELHYLKAEVLAKKDKYKAEREYKYLIKLAPKRAEYVLRLANLYIKDSAYLKARKVLKAYLKKNPGAKNDKRFSQYGLLIL